MIWCFTMWWVSMWWSSMWWFSMWWFSMWWFIMWWYSMWCAMLVQHILIMLVVSKHHLQSCMKLHALQDFTLLQVSEDRGRDMAYLHAQSTTCQGRKPSTTHTLDPSSLDYQQPDIGFLGCMDNPAAQTGLSAAQHRVSRVHGQPCSSNRVVSSPT